MHMFALNNEGPSEFSVVMSHADAQGDDSVLNFGQRLAAELETALPNFRLLATVERVVDDSPAIELVYRWFSEGKMMYQRQVITMLPRTEAGDVHAMLIAATCLNPFTDEWNAAFDGMLASVKLRDKKAPVVTEVLSSEPALASTVFALSERRRTLHAFANHEEACRKTDPREVEHDAWAFFDAAGTPLHPQFLVPNSGTVWRKAGSYVLELRPERGGLTLRERLHQASMFVAGSAAVRLSSIAEVQAMLDQLVEG